MGSVLLAIVLSIPITKDCPEDVGLGLITLGEGSQKVLKVPPVGEPTFSEAGVVELKRVENGLLLIIGLKSGVGNLKLPNPDGGAPLYYRVRVRKQDLFCASPSDDFRALFPCSSTLDFDIVGDRIVLDGKASTLAEWGGARKAVEQFGVLLLGRPSADVLPRTLSEANLALQRAGFPRARFAVAGDVVLLEGEVPEGERKRLEAVEREWRPKLELAVWKPKPAARDGGD